MNRVLPWALAFAAVSGSASAGAVRYECADAVAHAGEPFRRLAVLVDLTRVLFFDHHGRKFRFESPLPDGHLSLSLRHSVHGFVSATGGGAYPVQTGFAGLLLTPNGDLDGTDVHVDYGPHRGEGYLTALFTFFGDRLPDGAEFTFLDISSTRWIAPRLDLVGRPTLEAFAATPPGTQLYALFRKLRAVQSPGEPLLSGWDPRTALGFACYLADVATEWGRVARHGNFRRDYRAERAQSYLPLMRKYPIPPALRDEESALLAALPVAALVESILPPLETVQLYRFGR